MKTSHGAGIIFVHCILLVISCPVTDSFFTHSGLVPYNMLRKSTSSPYHTPNPDAMNSEAPVGPHFSHESRDSDYIDDIEEDGECDPIEQALLSEQEENQKLREDNLKMREHNRILVNRLQNAGESVSPQVGESELLIPELSCELLDNLVHENLRLKREVMLPSTLNSSEQFAQICQERDQLAIQLRQAQSLLKASSDEKNVELHRYNSDLANVHKENQELAAQCRQLVQQQDELRRSSLITENIQKISLDNGNESGLLAQLKQQNNNLQSQLQKLRTEFQEVVGSNKKWQEYDKQREEHIHRIITEKQELQLRINSSTRICSHQEVNPKKLQEFENERQRLLGSNRALEDRIEQLERDLNTAPSQEERERIHALESQLQLFKEDFYQERKDRENAQARASKLEDEKNLLKKQLEQFQTSHMGFLAQRRTNTMQQYRDEYDRQKNMQFNAYRSSGLVPHNTSFGQVVADGGDDEDEDVVDVPMAHSTSSLPAQQSTLECPKCHQQFPVDDPMQFLDHNDECTL